MLSPRVRVTQWPCTDLPNKWQKCRVITQGSAHSLRAGPLLSARRQAPGVLRGQWDVGQGQEETRNPHLEAWRQSRPRTDTARQAGRAEVNTCAQGRLRSCYLWDTQCSRSDRHSAPAQTDAVLLLRQMLTAEDHSSVSPQKWELWVWVSTRGMVKENKVKWAWLSAFTSVFPLARTWSPLSRCVCMKSNYTESRRHFLHFYLHFFIESHSFKFKYRKKKELRNFSFGKVLGLNFRHKMTSESHFNFCLFVFARSQHSLSESPATTKNHAKTGLQTKVINSQVLKVGRALKHPQESSKLFWASEPSLAQDANFLEYS